MPEKKERVIGEILPEKGLWTVESFAAYLKMSPADVQQKLTDAGVKVISFSSRYRAKFFRLEDLR